MRFMERQSDGVPQYCVTGRSYMEILYSFLLDTLPARLRNNYAKKFNTSIHFWHETGGGLPEETIRELLLM